MNRGMVLTTDSPVFGIPMPWYLWLVILTVSVLGVLFLTAVDDAADQRGPEEE